MESSDASIVTCPVCNCKSARVRLLPSSQIRSALEEQFGVTPPDTLPIMDYEMRHCTNCDLEFASPPLPAADAFYSWIDKNGNYYVGERWEWEHVFNILRMRAESGMETSVLEIGAGDGVFLKKLRNAFGASVAAIERSTLAADTLSRKTGIRAYTEEEGRYQLSGKTFDLVLAFHCLEHVEDPLNFIKTMCLWAGKDGRVMFSVPYSPMYFEHFRFDILNHPPHHLTRWNKRSLSELALQASGKAVLKMPKAYSVLRRSAYALALNYLGTAWYRKPVRARILPLFHPWRFLKELLIQLKRDKVNNRPASEVVLVEIVRV